MEGNISGSYHARLPKWMSLFVGHHDWELLYNDLYFLFLEKKGKYSRFFNFDRNLNWVKKRKNFHSQIWRTPWLGAPGQRDEFPSSLCHYVPFVIAKPLLQMSQGTITHVCNHLCTYDDELFYQKMNRRHYFFVCFLVVFIVFV